VKGEKSYAADEFYNGVASPLGACTTMEGFFLQFGNGGNIELRGILRDLIGYCS
jgi:hypothetical protein